jgi:predicted RNA-binding Zn-ribbon protein involved in translation (DUF1610 family)
MAEDKSFIKTHQVLGAMAKYSVTKDNVANDNGSVSFLCPGCQKQLVVRSRHERSIVAPYTCSECGFVGPN